MAVLTAFSFLRQRKNEKGCRAAGDGGVELVTDGGGGVAQGAGGGGDGWRLVVLAVWWLVFLVWWWWLVYFKSLYKIILFGERCSGGGGGLFCTAFFLHRWRGGIMAGGVEAVSISGGGGVRLWREGWRAIPPPLFDMVGTM